jgi:hypothetical protein
VQVYSLSEQNRFYKQAAAFCLRAVARHSPELAQAVIDSGALDSLVTCLEEFDPGVKEASAWTLGYIAGEDAPPAVTRTLHCAHPVRHRLPSYLRSQQQQRSEGPLCGHRRCKPRHDLVAALRRLTAQSLQGTTRSSRSRSWMRVPCRCWCCACRCAGQPGGRSAAMRARSAVPQSRPGHGAASQAVAAGPVAGRAAFQAGHSSGPSKAPPPQRSAMQPQQAMQPRHNSYTRPRRSCAAATASPAYRYAMPVATHPLAPRSTQRACLRWPCAAPRLASKPHPRSLEQEPELSLKRIASSALSDISKHTPELAQAVVDAGAVQYLAPLVINQDAKLKRQVCMRVFDTRHVVWHTLVFGGRASLGVRVLSEGLGFEAG